MANMTVSEQFERAIAIGRFEAIGAPLPPAPAPAGPDMLLMLPFKLRRQIFQDRLVDRSTRIELDNFRPHPFFYTSQQLGAEALRVYTQENAFTAYVMSNYLDICSIRKNLSKGRWDRARFRNPGQPRRHRLIRRKAGTAKWPGSRPVTNRDWTAADLAYSSGKLHATRRRFLQRPEARFRDVDIVVQALRSNSSRCWKAEMEVSVLEIRIVQGNLVMNATPPVTRPPFQSFLESSAEAGTCRISYRKHCWTMHKKARIVARRIHRAELAANNGTFEGFTLDHLKQIAGKFVYWP